MKIIVNKVELGKNENHIKITAFVPQRNVNKEYTFDYIGTDVISKQDILLPEQQENFKQQLNNDYGHAPFDHIDFAKNPYQQKQYDVLDII